MQINHCDSLRAYGEFLQRDHQESARLFAILLINVTSFFRDAEAFDALEKIVVPRFFSYGAVSLKEVVRRRSRPISPRAASCLPFETIDHAAAQDCKRWQTLDELPTNAVAIEQSGACFGRSVFGGGAGR
ncbi:hypothetical protein [Methylocystis rosea]|nr:hypothetical protein [Methylocystis rosea]